MISASSGQTHFLICTQNDMIESMRGAKDRRGDSVVGQINRVFNTWDMSDVFFFCEFSTNLPFNGYIRVFQAVHDGTAMSLHGVVVGPHHAKQRVERHVPETQAVCYAFGSVWGFFKFFKIKTTVSS